MNIKTYIAALLTFIFLAKFVAIDANALNLIFSGTELSFTNLNCKKKNFTNHAQTKTEFSQTDSTTSKVIALSGFCTSQFQLQLFSWETDILKTDLVFNEHLTSNLSYHYLDNDSPPPRQV